MTTTTGGAANVLSKLEDYLQTEWPELDVWLTSVTDHYATASVCGPNSKNILKNYFQTLNSMMKIFHICHLKMLN